MNWRNSRLQAFVRKQNMDGRMGGSGFEWVSLFFRPERKFCRGISTILLKSWSWFWPCSKMTTNNAGMSQLYTQLIVWSVIIVILIIIGVVVCVIQMKKKRRRRELEAAGVPPAAVGPNGEIMMMQRPPTYNPQAVPGAPPPQQGMTYAPPPSQPTPQAWISVSTPNYTEYMYVLCSHQALSHRVLLPFAESPKKLHGTRNYRITYSKGHSIKDAQ